MAGKQFPSLAHARPASSRCLLAVGALLLLSAVYFLLLSPSPPRPVPSPLSNPSATTSFVASLDRFLDSPHEPAAASSAPPKDLDAAIRRAEEARLYGDPGGAWPAAQAPPLRVYVYEMPRKFTYDLLRLFRDSYRHTDNLTSNGSPVHRLIEQHSIDYWLWADLIAPEPQRLLKNVIRVGQQEDADVFYVSFFTTISYFLLEKQECKALYRVWEHFSRKR